MIDMGNFTLSTVIAYLLFGAVGLFGFLYGKKSGAIRVMLVGIVLMAYPYFVSGALALYGIGCFLTALLVYWWE